MHPNNINIVKTISVHKGAGCSRIQPQGYPRCHIGLQGGPLYMFVISAIISVEYYPLNPALKQPSHNG